MEREADHLANPVSERFAEIALLRVEGATIRSVVFPLFVEGGVLALLAIGPGLGLGIFVVEQFFRPVLIWSPHLPLDWLWWLIPGFIGVGAISNLLPARAVARLSPAQVLGENR